MAAKGHPNFKSVDMRMPDIASFIDWFDSKLNVDLDMMKRFKKRCPPWETGEWEKKELKEFKIEFNQIDRFYHLIIDSDAEDEEEESREIYCRMDYKDRPLYFNLQPDRATIYVTFNAEVFLKAMLDEYADLNDIWKSMVEDGLVMEKPSWQDFIDLRPWGPKEYQIVEEELSWLYYSKFLCNLGAFVTEAPPTLKFLCHATVYNNQKELKHYAEILPDILAKGITQFIRIRTTRRHRQKHTYGIKSETYSDVNSGCEFKDGGSDTSSSDESDDDSILCDNFSHFHENHSFEDISDDFYNEHYDEDDAHNSDSGMLSHYLGLL